MLDGFVNGSYDWVDLNAGTWLRTVGILVTAIVVATTDSVRSFRRKERSSDR